MGLRTPINLRDPAERELAVRITASWKEMRRGAAMAALRDHLMGVGPDALESGQVDTLDLLVKRDAWRMSDLADALRVDPSTATRAVQRLVRVGLAERRASEEDGRVVMVTATTTGRERHRVIAQRRRALMADMLAAFEPDERRQLADLMDRFVAALDDIVSTLP